MTQGIDVTVAAIIERDDRFLLVEELVSGRRVLNQPAGHLEPGESLVEAVVREAREETGYGFEPKQLVGIYLWQADEATTFLRVTFCGSHVAPRGPIRLDEGIVATHWLTRAEMAARNGELRSPMVLRCLDDYLAGVRHSLETVTHLPAATLAAAAAARKQRARR
jgi:8-oxo-dGTP pyrophosphatase MutT (NUDIX family)